jgi:hypothetical protein
MTKFKFFRGYVGTLNVMDGQTYPTASFYDSRTLTNDERLIQINRRLQIDEEMRNQIRMSQEQYNLNRDMFAQQEIVRRQRIETDNQIRLYQATRVTTVNPKWWMKIKIAFQETWLSDPIGVVVITLLASVVTIIGIAKILSVF